MNAFCCRKNYHFKYIDAICKSIGLVILVMVYSCTNQSQKINRNTVSQKSIATDTCLPKISLLDTCPSPEVVTMPTNAVNQANHTVTGSIQPADFYFAMQVFNTEQGLPFSAILCSYCDQQGNMWFGTDGGGVSRFDGHTFTNFSTRQGLVDNHVRCILQDSKNNMWFGTFGEGVSCYDGTKIINYTVKDGLTSNYVYTIFENHAHELLLGCTKGICRFKNSSDSTKNNQAFSTYPMPPYFMNRPVYSIIQDTSNTLWIGTAKGFYCEKTTPNTNSISSKFKEFSAQSGVFDTTILSLLIDNKGYLWAGTHMGISIFEIARLNEITDSASTKITDTTTRQISSINVSHIDTLLINDVIGLTKDDKGTIWFGSKNGVHYFDGVNFKNITAKQGLVSNHIQSVTIDLQNNLWFSTYGAGVNLYTGNAFQYCSTTQGLINNEVTCFLKDSRNNLWIGTNNGISILSGEGNTPTDKSKRTANYASALKNNTTINTSYFNNFDFKDGSCGKQIRNIYEDKSGYIWVSTNDNGVTKFAPVKNQIAAGKTTCNKLTAVEKYTKANGLMSNHVRAVLEDRVGNIWIVNFGGISKLSNKNIDVVSTHNNKNNIKKELTNYGLRQGVPEELTYCIAEDLSGNLWFGTQSHGVYCFDVNRVDAINKGVPFTGENFIGLKKHNGKYVASFTNYTQANGLGSNCVFRIRCDQNGILWFATYDGGLSRFNPAELGQDKSSLFLNFTTNEGLANNSVYDFVFDKNKNIIIGTNLGFSVLKNFNYRNSTPQLKPSSLDKVPALNNLSNGTLLNDYQPQFENFNKSTGYAIKDIVNDAMYYENNGIVWAGCGDSKLARFELKSIAQENSLPTVSIQNIKLNDEDICWLCLPENASETADKESIIMQLAIYGKKITEAQKVFLRKQYAAIKFDGVTRFYGLPENLKLDYKHNSLAIDYSAIDPSSANLYTYQYQLTGYHTAWSPVTKKTSATFGNIDEGYYTFKLKACNAKGIWSLPTSYSFTVLPPWYRSKWAYFTYILILILIVWGIIKWRELNYKKKVAFEKRISEVEMQALRSQMNPHFIFNSLHAINKFVMDNDKIKASEYLSKFSKLMRMVLENSREQEVILANDLDALKLYMQMEALRFQNSFQFIITVADSIDTENTLIAPLLLQPFVENAILHGIRGKENGLIKIEIMRKDTIMHCSIEDNGFGREHLVSTESGENTKRKSLGMKITQERLQIIEQLKKVKTTIEIKDLIDNENRPCGLRIELQLPYENAF